MRKTRLGSPRAEHHEYAKAHAQRFAFSIKWARESIKKRQCGDALEYLIEASRSAGSMQAHRASGDTGSMKSMSRRRATASSTRGAISRLATEYRNKCSRK